MPQSTQTGAPDCSAFQKKLQSVGQSLQTAGTLTTYGGFIVSGGGGLLGGFGIATVDQGAAYYGYRGFQAGRGISAVGGGLSLVGQGLSALGRNATGLGLSEINKAVLAPLRGGYQRHSFSAWPTLRHDPVRFRQSRRGNGVKRRAAKSSAERRGGMPSPMMRCNLVSG